MRSSSPRWSSCATVASFAGGSTETSSGGLTCTCSERETCAAMARERVKKQRKNEARTTKNFRQDDDICHPPNHPSGNILAQIWADGEDFATEPSIYFTFVTQNGNFVPEIVMRAPKGDWKRGNE